MHIKEFFDFDSGQYICQLCGQELRSRPFVSQLKKKDLDMANRRLKNGHTSPGGEEYDQDDFPEGHLAKEHAAVAKMVQDGS